MALSKELKKKLAAQKKVPEKKKLSGKVFRALIIAYLILMVIAALFAFFKFFIEIRTYEPI